MLRRLFEAIDRGDDAEIEALLAADPALARAAIAEGATRAQAEANFLPRVLRYIYAGDTALHFAAAACRADLISRLVALGADVEAANRRGHRPLHAAAAGHPAVPGWDPDAQAAATEALIAAGADPNAAAMGAVTPLHIAVRTRSASVVEALLKAGADPNRRNGSGSTPLKLATLTTGRGGSGSPEAKAEQARILELLG